MGHSYAAARIIKPHRGESYTNVNNCTGNTEMNTEMFRNTFLEVEIFHIVVTEWKQYQYHRIRLY
jgi:hypothetical protein